MNFVIFREKGRCILVSLFLLKKRNVQRKQTKKSLSGGADFFEKEISRCVCLSGSMTVEACIAVPLAACLFVFVLFFFRVMQVELLVQEALENTGRNLSVCASVLEKEEEQTAQYLALANVMFLKELSGEEMIKKYVSGKVSGINLNQSEFSGEKVQLNAKYQIKFPIAVFGRKTFAVCQHTSYRKWIGLKKGVNQNDTDTWVYVADHGVVYHKTSGCSYLSLSIQSISQADILDYRNENGEKYYQCEVCAHKKNKFGKVYITNYGNRYHLDLNCRALNRTIEMVKLSETGEMRACSKCWK